MVRMLLLIILIVLLSRTSSRVAVQCGLGILSERRSWPGLIIVMILMLMGRV